MVTFCCSDAVVDRFLIPSWINKLLQYDWNSVNNSIHFLVNLLDYNKSLMLKYERNSRRCALLYLYLFIVIWRHLTFLLLLTIPTAHTHVYLPDAILSYANRREIILSKSTNTVYSHIFNYSSFFVLLLIWMWRFSFYILF